MLAHNIGDILTLAPEAKELIKMASIEEDYPSNNRDSVCASYLRIQYLTKVAKKIIPPEKIEFITKAACLYGMKDKLDIIAKSFDPAMEKSAEAKIADLYSEFEFNFSGFRRLEKVAHLAEQLKDSGFTGDERVERYSGSMLLNKEAAILTLANRYHATKEPSFVKLAHIIDEQIKINDSENIRKLCHTVVELDKQAGLDIIGFDFYKDAFMTKEAACSALMVNIAGDNVPIEKLERFGKENLGAVLGKEVAGDYTNDLVSNKYMLEALPMDSQRVLKFALKGI